jgi:hypothetical protein
MAVGAPAAASDNMNADLLADHAFRRWGVLVDERFDFIAPRKKAADKQAPWPPSFQPPRPETRPSITTSRGSGDADITVWWNTVWWPRRSQSKSRDLAVGSPGLELREVC